MDTKYKAQEHLHKNLCTINECVNLNLLTFYKSEFIPRYSIAYDSIRRGRSATNAGDTDFNHERIMCTHLELVPMIYEVKKTGVWQSFEILEGCAARFFSPIMVGEKFLIFAKCECENEFGTVRRPIDNEIQELMEVNHIDAIASPLFFQKNKNF